MTLRGKIALVVCGTLVMLTGGLYVFASGGLLADFHSLERAEMEENLTRARNALRSAVDEIDTLALDWSPWDDAYQFIQDGNPAFPEVNLIPSVVQTMRLDVVVFTRNSGHILFGRMFDAEDAKLVDIPPSLLKHLTPGSPLVTHSTARSVRKGLLSLPEGLLLLSSRPILTSRLEGPIHGSVIFGRFLRADGIRRLSDLMRLDISLQPLDHPSADAREAARRLTSTSADEYFIETLDDHRIVGHTLIGDLYGNHVLLLGIQCDRPIHRQGKASLRLLGAAVVCVGLISALVTLILLNRLVVSRLARLASQLNEIGHSGNHLLRVSADGGDELAGLARCVNGTLDALWQSQNQLRITQFVMDRAADAILWVTADASIAYANDAACRSMGYTREELIGRKIPDINPDFGPERWQEHWREVLSDRSVTFETRHRRKDGSIFPVEINANYFKLGDVEYSCAFGRDITERQRTSEQLRRAALHDALTGLPNRTMLLEHLSLAIARSRRHGDYRFAVMFLDFDRFKVINDSLGHESGDVLLVEISRRLQACLRGQDIISSSGKNEVSRLGGDEFVILLDGIREVTDAARIAERIQEAMAVPFDLNGVEAHVTVSIGIVCAEGQYSSPEEMLRDADTAMYRAKNTGKARHVIFDQKMHQDAMRRLQLEADLRKGLERGEFIVVYQPIALLDSGELRGYEALVRWRHPERGMISPDEFIPVAEETGLIVPLGRQVLVQACRKLVEIHRTFEGESPPIISVNLSKRQLIEEGLVEDVRQVLRETGLEARYLQLEVTESVIMDHAEMVTPVLRQLKTLGVTLAMDDFGTGHSSLSCLHRFPIDCLKIDRAFIGNMGINESGLNIEYTAIVQAIITLAHNLHMRVVAEGIETMGQLVQLQSLNCDMGQGYLLSKPLSEQEVLDFQPHTEWITLPVRDCRGTPCATSSLPPACAGSSSPGDR